MYYNSVSSLDGLDGDILGISHVGARYECRGDEIVMGLSYCMSSCGTQYGCCVEVVTVMWPTSRILY